MASDKVNEEPRPKGRGIRTIRLTCVRFEAERRKRRKIYPP